MPRHTRFSLGDIQGLGWGKIDGGTGGSRNSHSGSWHQKPGPAVHHPLFFSHHHITWPPLYSSSFLFRFPPRDHPRTTHRWFGTGWRNVRASACTCGCHGRPVLSPPPWPPPFLFFLSAAATARAPTVHAAGARGSGEPTVSPGRPTVVTSGRFHSHGTLSLIHISEPTRPY